jgi:hypothetical protein
MARADASSTRHVVDRCPRCGVENDPSADSVCEACDTPLRAWCRVHGRETGWLDGPGCQRCAEDAARRRASPSSRMPCPAPAPVTMAARPAAASPVAGVTAADAVVAEGAKPPRPPRPQEHFGVMVLMLLLSMGSVALVGVVAAFLYLLSGRGTLPDTALRFATGGAIMGLVVGVVTCLHYVTTLRTPPRAP